MDFLVPFSTVSSDMESFVDAFVVGPFKVFVFEKGWDVWRCGMRSNNIFKEPEAAQLDLTLNLPFPVVVCGSVVEKFGQFSAGFAV